MLARFRLDGAEYPLWLSRHEGGYRLHRADAQPDTQVAPDHVYALLPGRESFRRVLPGRESARRVLTIDGHHEGVAVALEGDDVHVHLGGRSYVVTYLDPVRSLAGDAIGSAENEARAPMPGMVVAVHVRPGDTVEAGDALVVIESMKLETTIRAPRAGTIATVLVAEGQGFDRDQILATLAEAA